MYGLCVGFCEAQDCEATFNVVTGDVTFGPNCKKRSARLLEVYNEHANPGDPAMPCVVVENECPCWEAADVESLFGACVDETVECFDGTTLTEIEGSRIECRVGGDKLITFHSLSAAHATRGGITVANCNIHDVPGLEDTPVRGFPVTVEEANACRQLLRDRFSDCDTVETNP